MATPLEKNVFSETSSLPTLQFPLAENRWSPDTGVLNLAQGGCEVGAFLGISKVLNLLFTFGAHSMQTSQRPELTQRSKGPPVSINYKRQ